MKKIMIYGSLALIIVIVVAIFVGLSNPLRRSEAEIRQSMLELTPAGTSMNDVLTVIEDHKKWEMSYVSYDHGISQGDLGKSGDDIGEKSIRAMIGKYNFDPRWDKEEVLGSIIYTFIDRYVSVFWAFDENSKLIDIYVTKDAAGF